MAELVGLVASFITVVGMGAKISSSLLKCVDRAVSADHQMHTVARDLSLFNLTLEHFISVLREHEGMMSREGVKLARKLLAHCNETYAGFGQLAMDAKQVLKEGQKEMKQGARKRVMARIKAFFSEPRVATQLAELECLKSTLGLLIQTLTLAAMMKSTRQECMQQSSRSVPQPTEQRLADLRVQIENLIMTRQLSLNFFFQKAVEEDEAYAKEGAHISPTASEDSFEEVKHPQLLLESPEVKQQGLVRFQQRPGMDYLRMALPDPGMPFKKQGETSTETPILFAPSHQHLIDQLLSRWTVLDHPEEAAKMEQQRGRRGKTPVVEEETEGSAADSPLPTVQSPEEMTEEPSYDPPPRPSPSRQTSGGNVPTTSSSIGPPPKNTANLRRKQSSLQPPPATLARSLSTPAPESLNVPIRGPSPKPSLTNAISVRSRDTQMAPYSPTSRYRSQPAFSPQVSPRNSYTPASNLHSNFKPARVSESASDSGSDIDEEARMGTGADDITWTMRRGTEYWDLMEDRVIGPNTPWMPPETLSDLLKMQGIQTEISEKWVSERVLRERNIKYRAMRETFTGGRTWVIQRPLSFKEVESLVEQSGDMDETASERDGRPYGNQPPQGMPPQQQQRRPPNLQTSHGQPPPQYQSPTSYNAREAWANMPKPPHPTNDQNPRRHLSYNDPTPQQRPGTSGSTGSRLSADFSHASAQDRSVHFTPSTAGEPSPRRRDFDRPHDREPPRYDGPPPPRRHRRPAERERDRDHDLYSDSDESRRIEEKREKVKRRSRAAKIGGSLVAMVGALEGLDALLM